MKIFEEPEDFVSFLEDNEVIKSVTPFADELVNLHNNINKGCKCKQQARIGFRDSTYLTLLENILAHNIELQDLYKKYGGFNSAQFKINNRIILEI